MKNIKDYKDDRQRIIQSDGNCIDSAFLTCNYYYQSKLEYGNYMALEFVNHDMKFIRYPISNMSSDEAKYWSDPRTVSRDNSIGTYICLAEIGFYDYCRTFAFSCLMRCNFYQNTHTVKMEKKLVPDFVGISGWSILLRGLMKRSWLLYPLIMFCDVFLLLSFIFFILKNKYIDPDYNSPLFHMVSTAKFCAEKTPTIFSIAARYILYKFCPVHEQFEGFSGVSSQLREYSRYHFDPPIYEVSDRLEMKYNK